MPASRKKTAAKKSVARRAPKGDTKAAAKAAAEERIARNIRETTGAGVVKSRKAAKKMLSKSGARKKTAAKKVTGRKKTAAKKTAAKKTATRRKR